MKSIYEIYIPVKDQPQANRLKAICLEYGLPIATEYDGFEYFADYKYFTYGKHSNTFSIYSWNAQRTESTEEEFINLLKEMKK